jgi:hypothetical protein
VVAAAWRTKSHGIAPTRCYLVKYIPLHAAEATTKRMILSPTATSDKTITRVESGREGIWAANG